MVYELIFGPTVQRITRYPLLIKQVPIITYLSHSLSHILFSKILQHTQTDSDRKQISTALNAVERVLNIINESIREQEGRERLAVVSKNLYVGQG